VEKLTDKLQAKDDCSNFDSLPTIGFKVQNKVLNLAPEDYMDNSAGDCSFSVMSLDVPPPKGPLFIFGDPFLRRFVTIYDKNGPRVGFAVAKHGDLDAAQAAKIISDVKGKHEEHPALAAKEPVVSTKATVAVSLEAGMMTRDSGSADHSDSTADTTDSDDSSASKSSSSSANDSATNKKTTSLGDDFASAVAHWVRGGAARAAAAVSDREVSLVQNQGLGLRGRHSAEAPQLITVRLHKSPGPF